MKSRDNERGGFRTTAAAWIAMDRLHTLQHHALWASHKRKGASQTHASRISDRSGWVFGLMCQMVSIHRSAKQGCPETDYSHVPSGATWSQRCGLHFTLDSGGMEPDTDRGVTQTVDSTIHRGWDAANLAFKFRQKRHSAAKNILWVYSNLLCKVFKFTTQIMRHS